MHDAFLLRAAKLGSGWKNGTSYFMGGRGPALSRDHAHTISDPIRRARTYASA